MKNYWHLRGLESNFLKYTIALVANKRIFVAILGAYYLTIPGVTPWWIGVILLVSSLSGFFFEIPSGYVADKMGHKKALVIHSVFLVLSTTFFLFAENIFFLILGGIFLSVGHAFMSGTGSAFMHETMRALKLEHEFRERMGKMSSIGFAIPVGLTVIVPFLVGVNWHAPFLIALILDIIGLIATCSLIVPAVSPEHIDEVRLTNFKQVMQEAWRIHFFRYALFSGILGGVMLGMSGFRAVYQSVLGIPIIWFGVLFGIGRSMASVLLWYTGPIQRALRTPLRIYSLKLVLFASFFLTLGVVDSPTIVAIVFILINAFHWGLSQVGYSAEAVRDSKFKATLLSVKSQIQALIGAFAAFFLGYLIEMVSFQKSFLIYAVIFILALTPVLYAVYKDTKGKDGGLSDGDGGE